MRPLLNPASPDHLHVHLHVHLHAHLHVHLHVHMLCLHPSLLGYYKRFPASPVGCSPAMLLPHLAPSCLGLHHDVNTPPSTCTLRASARAAGIPCCCAERVLCADSICTPVAPARVTLTVYPAGTQDSRCNMHAFHMIWIITKVTLPPPQPTILYQPCEAGKF